MLESNRLILKPLTYKQLLKYLEPGTALEEELGLNGSNRSISPELKEALEKTIIPSVGDPAKDYRYSTLWTVISKQQNQVVGDLCFYGEPDIDGNLEVGYGTYAEFRGQGYMTEALGALILWTENQANIRGVLATTEKNNLASAKVLEKNNFIKKGESESMIHWQRKFRP